LSVGDELKPGFEIEQILEGGMGIAYICKASPSGKVWDPEQGRVVEPNLKVKEGRDERRWVFKTFRPEVLKVAGGVASFEKECLLWSTLLPHPNVVRAATVDYMGERFYLMLDYVDGGDLARRLLKGALNIDEATGIALQFCVGMQFVSETYGVVHRDIKPSNVLLTSDGVAKVTDFGLVQASLSGGADRVLSPVVDDQLLTMAGAIVGTLPYMSPEQLSGLPLDSRSDVYAFGVMFYEMLLGRRPFNGSTVQELRRQHLHDTPTSLRLCGDIPTQLSDIVDKCLAKSSSERFASFAELVEQLESFCHSNGLARVIPEKPSAVELEQRMGFHDWSGKAYALSKLAEAHRKPNTEAQRKFFERSHDYYMRALNLDPTGLFANSNVGTSLLRLGRPRDALTYYEREVELHPDQARVHSASAGAYFQLGEKQKAIDAYERAIALEPEATDLLRQLAGFYSVFGRESDRLRIVEQLLRTLSQLSESKAAGVAIGTAVVSGDWGDIRSALDLHHYSVTRWPDLSLGWYNFGVTLHRAGAFDKARTCYDRCLRLDARLTVALLNRGLILTASGAIAEAYRDLRLAAAQGEERASAFAAKFIEIIDLGAGGAATIARDVKQLKPMLEYKLT